MFTTFKNSDFQQQLEENGFVVFPLLNQEDIAQLQNRYNAIKHLFSPKGFHATPYSDNITYKWQVHNAIKETVVEKAKTYFTDHRFLVGNFVVKEPGEESRMPMHQDWAFVDESQYCSISMWCPLVDVNEHNGHLQVLSKSHIYLKGLRGTPHFPNHTFWASISPEVQKKYTVSLTIPAGTVVAYDHRLIHFSPPNLSQQTRVAINFAMIPTAAKVYHYYQNNHNEIEQYEVDTEFFLTQKITEKPQSGTLVSTINNTNTIEYPEQKQPRTKTLLNRLMFWQK